MKKLTYNNTNIYIKENLLNEVFMYLKEYEKIHVITDLNVSNLYINELVKNFDNKEYYIYTIKPGEKSKSIKTYQNIINELIKNNAQKDHLIIGFGGGVVLDIASFVASTYFRGLSFVSIPTTIISMIDSSIGGKNGIDYQNIKNNIGTFYNPKTILIDPNLLKTLPKKEYKNGLGEVIKTALIGDKTLFESMKKSITLNSDTIYTLASIKVDVVSVDPYEKNLRKVLNFGHTMGHAIEAVSNYKISHGEAVIYGIIYAIKLGIEKNFTDKKVLAEVMQVLKKYKLATKIIDYKEYYSKIKYDKKNHKDGLDFIFLSEIGKPVIVRINDYEIKNL